MKSRRTFHCVLAALLAGGSAGVPTRLAAADAPPTAMSHKVLYALTPRDVIHIEVVGESELTAAPRIDGHGNVNLVYVGEVHVAGLTTTAAQEVIQKAYVDGEYLKHPQVTITVEEYAPRSVAISGAVKAPGRFDLPPESSMSVVELVTKAGGFTDVGKGSDVRITHPAANGGKTDHVDVQGIITGKSSVKADDESLMLQPGDIVYVPEKII